MACMPLCRGWKSTIIFINWTTQNNPSTWLKNVIWAQQMEIILYFKNVGAQTISKTKQTKVHCDNLN